MACQLVCGAAQLGAAVLVLSGRATVWALAGLAVVAGAAGAFFQPAAKGLVVQLVPAGPMLVQANALLQICFNVVAIAGPGLAGLVIAASSPGVILAWDALTFLVSARGVRHAASTAGGPAGAAAVSGRSGGGAGGLRRAPLAVAADRVEQTFRER
ncbi:hypothetical protein [Nonomuraea sp. GTA35]|uniref:hypothetical protein n=1 Tax=Nonomuraea sp. GTA35 TaxID=1676746 RepID=UPI0035BF12FB